MKQSTLPVTTSFGTLGPLQRQVRQMLNAAAPPQNADERAVAFTLFNGHTGVLPDELECRHWVYLEENSPEDAVLVRAAASGKAAVYLAINLTERALLAAMKTAVAERSMELMLSGPNCATSHRLTFSSAEADCLESLLAEYLDLDLVHNPDWLTSFGSVVPRLPFLCGHMHPGLSDCARHSCIVLRGNYDTHLSALRTAIRQRTF